MYGEDGVSLLLTTFLYEANLQRSGKRWEDLIRFQLETPAIISQHWGLGFPLKHGENNKEFATI
jgi:hypothetical protein